MDPEGPLRILLVGNGGREHALAAKLGQSPLVEHIFAVPGNGGTSTCSKTTNVTEVKPNDYPGLVKFAQTNKINLVVPGPEAPLVDGIEGYFRDVNIPCYGPSKKAAQMEGSKTFSKDFMRKHKIPTAAYENFSDYNEARRYLEKINHKVVIKADGLAAGKGVIMPETKEEEYAALKEIMLNREFGEAGDEVVIEEFLEGDEVSILSFCDGVHIRSLPPAQDHKRIWDGDKGPNTGGMGCYAPIEGITGTLLAEIESTILEPTLAGMRKDGFMFIGTLFTGLMITKEGPKVLEYNVRFGDPETQTVLPLLKSDLARILWACTTCCLDLVPVEISNEFSATVIIAAGGYPGKYLTGTPMSLQTPPTDVNHFHAGTTVRNGQLQTSGGRVIASSSTGKTLKEAVDKAYSGVRVVKFEGMQYRKDIAYRAFRNSISSTSLTTTAHVEPLTYAAAGVDIEAGNRFVERIKNAVSSTKRPGADAEIGGFAGELDLEKAAYPGAPIMVGCIDGVGTKLAIAQSVGKHDTVGIDLVAMNVNDLIVAGAVPLMFLDYIGCSRLNLEIAAPFVEGVATGCIQAGCALVGGETAEMPGMYQGEDYDAAGVAVGCMYSEQRLPRKESMTVGDVLLGLASNGLHSNGFSLVRRILGRAGVKYSDMSPWDETTPAGESLLTPTRIYVKSLLPVINKGTLKGLSHITGGGLLENIPRMLPDHLAAEVDVATWTLPPVFKWLKVAGNVASEEMAKTFNTGIGMVAVVSKVDAAQVKLELEKAGELVYIIGALIPRESGAKGCICKNLEVWG